MYSYCNWSLTRKISVIIFFFFSWRCRRGLKSIIEQLFLYVLTYILHEVELLLIWQVCIGICMYIIWVEEMKRPDP